MASVRKAPKFYRKKVSKLSIFTKLILCVAVLNFMTAMVFLLTENNSLNIPQKDIATQIDINLLKK
ncbi:MAG: putative ABC-type sugar transport system permease subunit [Rickettsiales bacterium]|jgi:predicted ABC-type sugar transport system permease subunit